MTSNFYEYMEQLKNLQDEFSPDFESYCELEDPEAPVWKFSAKFGERNDMATELEAQVHAWSEKDAKNIISSEGGFSIKLLEKPSQLQFQHSMNKIKDVYGDEVANSLY